MITPVYVTESTSTSVVSGYTHATGMLPAPAVPYLLAVANCAPSASAGPADTPTAGGTTGLDWVNLATINFGGSPTFRRLTVFGACKPDADDLTTGTVTTSYAGTQASTVAQLISLAGADATLDVAAILGQTADVQESGASLVGTYQPTTPDNFDDPDNILMTFWSTNQDRKLNPHVDTPTLVKLRETPITGSKVAYLMSAWNDGQLLNPKVQARDTTNTSDSTARIAAILLEIVVSVAPGGGTTITGMRLGLRLG